MNLKSINNRLLYLITLLLISFSSLSFQWPVRNGRITSTFGESRWDHFHDGIDMVSQDNLVYPVTDGKLLFCWDRSLFPLENYQGGGNYAVLQHEKNICSIYMHLDKIYISDKIYDKTRIIGLAGNSGHSFSAHLHFSILDLSVRSSMNPQKMLPGINDNIAPEINEIAVKIDDKYFIIKENSDFRLTKHYPLLIKITDTITGREKLGIYKLKAVFNDITAVDIIFNKIDFSEIGMTLSGKLYEKIMDEGGYYALPGIQYKNGWNTVMITATDLNGNCSEKSYRFNVELDLQ